MRKVLLPIVSIILLVTSCSGVYYGGVSGSVVDESNNGINDVLVALYLDSSARDSDYNSYDSSSHAVFSPSSHDSITYTANNGTYSFSKVWWETNSPKYGKDADRTEVYLLFYHEDYGLQKSESYVTLYSESTSQIETMKMENITDTYRYNVNLMEILESSGNEITASDTTLSPITFRYEYTDYRGKTQRDYVTATGTFSFDVTFYSDVDNPQIPSITLSEFEGQNTRTKGTEIIEEYSPIDTNLTYTLKKAEGTTGRSQTDNIYFYKNWFTISISGQVKDDVGGVNGATVELDIPTSTAYTISPSSAASASTTYEGQVADGRQAGMFSSLGSDLTIFINDDSKGNSVTIIATVNAEAATKNGTTNVTLTTNDNSKTCEIILSTSP